MSWKTQGRGGNNAINIKKSIPDYMKYVQTVELIW